MIIDEIMPIYHFNEVHTAIVPGSPSVIYPIINNLNFGRSLIIRFLFLLRGIPKTALTLRGFLNMGFILLAEHKNTELVLGYVGNVVKWHPESTAISPTAFSTFNEKGNIKLTWNFCIIPHDNASTKVVTQTRIYCTDDIQIRRFAVYWFMIRPFSGMIRRMILRIIRKEAQQIK